MDRLPVEVLLKIFEKLPTHDLIPMLYVNHMFNTVASEVLELRWKNDAHSDLPWSLFCLLTKKRYPLHCVDDYDQLTDSLFWRRMYFYRNIWKSCITTELKLFEQVIQFPEFHRITITCLATCGEFLAVGTERFELLIFRERADYIDHHGERYEFLYRRNTESISKIIFWCPDETNMIVIAKTKLKLKFWNLNDGREIIVRREYLAENICAGTGGNFFSEHRGGIQAYSYHKWGIKNKLLHRSYDVEDDYTAEIISVEKKVKVIRAFRETIDIVNVSTQSNDVSVKSIYLPQNAAVSNDRKVYLLALENSNDIIITYDNFFAVRHQESWREFTTSETFGRAVTAITLHGDTIFLAVTKDQQKYNLCVIQREEFFRCQTDEDFLLIQKQEYTYGYFPIIQIETINNRNYPALVLSSQEAITVSNYQSHN